MDVFPYLIQEGLASPKIAGRGRPIGSGCNRRLLARMKPGDSIWDIPEKKALSLRSSATKANIKVSIILVQETGLYTIIRK